LSRVDDLIENYGKFVKLPWQANLSPAQRVWMAVYPPDDERRLRLHLPEFENASKQADHEWQSIDVSGQFEIWMANHEYRDAYFESPNLIQPELVGFFEHLVSYVKDELAAHSTDNAIVGLVGAGSLYGLGDHVKVSALIEQVHDLVNGRLLVFFPGEVEGNNFRLMGAQDGWNYHAVVITAEKGWLR